MKTKEIKGLDLTVYEKTLKNGLKVIIVPSKKVNNAYVTYSTRYGGNDNEFVSFDTGKMTKVPLGIAHFLEHKMFESEDDTDVFSYFQERGANCNANTTSKKTTYLFSGTNKFYENLKFLLEYVESPYFTDENVEKEKGIIEQEIMMYKDNPYARIYEGILYNTFINHPFKYPVIGTKKSVYEITKEDLYTCYNTFYHPSNMFLVVTGNIDVEKTMELIEEHENMRKISKETKIERKKFKEPDEVEKKHETIHLEVTIPKVAIAFKINIEKIKNMHSSDIYGCLLNLIDLKVGATSLFTEKLKNEGLITESFDVGIIKADKHFILTIDNETKEPKKVMDLLLEELKDLTIEEKEFERRKKTGISSLLYMSDNIFKVNNKMVSDIMERKEIETDPIKRIREYSLKDVEYIIENINLDHYTIYTVLPEKPCKHS